MILGRNIFTGLLVYGTGTPICRHCWKGDHHKCNSRADKWNKCACDTWPMTTQEHAEGSLFKEMRK